MPRINLSLFDITEIEAGSHKKSYQNSTAHNHAEAGHKVCERPSCNDLGHYRAPKSPQNLNEYRFFCLKHIREHNKRWNFCAEMSEQEIVDFLEKDTIGHRPTWNKNGQSSTARTHQAKQSAFKFDDPFDFAKTIFDDADFEEYKQPAPLLKPKKDIIDACNLLEITYPPKLSELREQYKTLVKKYHPDINKNNPMAEKKLRLIIDAYQIIKKYLD